jgi:hypothetical protein
MNTSALCISIIALTAMVAGPTAQAAEPRGTLMFACEGTKIETQPYGGDAEQRETISMGIIIDFAARTVTGFRSEELLVRPVITDVSETTISFTGSSDPPGATVSYSMYGNIDRMTGALEAGFISSPKEGYGRKWTRSYRLKCRPTQRMF